MSELEQVKKDISGEVVSVKTKKSDVEDLVKGGFGYNIVTQHNHLVGAQYDLNVTEKKLLLGCICKINSFNEINSSMDFSFSLEEAAEVFGFELSTVSSKSVTDQFQEAAGGLVTHKIINSNVDGWAVTTFAQSAKYDRKTKVMTIRFADDIIPYLSNLSANLTSYRILHVGKLTSKFAMRLYEVIAMWIGKDYRKYRRKKVSIEDLKLVLGVAGQYEKSISMFKNSVIEPACLQINEMTNIKVDFEYEKTGRKITHILFKFDHKPEWVDVEKEMKKKLTKSQVDKIVNNADFFTKYFEEYRYLGGVTEFLTEAKKRLSENPKKYFADYASYLKES